MDGKTFVEKFTRILEKVSKIRDIDYDDWMIISDDPDCDANYGVDANGNLVIDEYRTNLKLSELLDIRYRAKKGIYLKARKMRISHWCSRMISYSICILIQRHISATKNTD